jgi:competence protein ComEA
MKLEILQKVKLGDLVMAAGLGLIVAGVGEGMRQQYFQGQKVEVVKRSISPSPSVVQVNSKVMIDIAGAVVKPGVYEMLGGTRIKEVLIEAGGLSSEASRDWVETNLNQAEKVYDGQKIYIPKKSESLKVESRENGKVLGGQSQGLISLNNASAKELEELPGVGPKMAEKIINYRQTNGGFKDINELKLVSGIGEKMFDKLKEQIRI